MTGLFIASVLLGLFIVFARKLDQLTLAHFEWRLVEFKFEPQRKTSKKPLKAKSPRAVKASKAPRQLKSVKRLPP